MATERPGSDGPPTDEPAPVEPAADWPAAVEPAAHEPPTDEPVADEPAAVEPAADWPAGGPARGRGGDAAAPDPSAGRLGVRGPVLVGLVLAFALVLSLAAVWAFGLRSTDDGPYRALGSGEFDVRVATCTVDERGRPVVTGSVRNRSGERRSLVVEIEILDPATEVIDTPRATAASLADGASVRWEARSPYDVGRLTPLTCRVADVFAARGE